MMSKPFEFKIKPIKKKFKATHLNLIEQWADHIFALLKENYRPVDLADYYDCSLGCITTLSSGSKAVYLAGAIVLLDKKKVKYPPIPSMIPFELKEKGFNKRHKKCLATS